MIDAQAGRIKLFERYSGLQAISKDAWAIVKQCEVPTVSEDGTYTKNGGVTENVTDVTFTENLLRDILHLTPEQQLELVTELADRKITKGKFKTHAKAYALRNELIEECQQLDARYSAKREGRTRREDLGTVAPM